MDPEVLEKYKKAGKICSQVRETILSEIQPGMKILTLAEKIEDMIKEKGGEFAFPVNISINEITAHYTPSFNDQTRIQDGDVVKIDIGVHVDGYIGDMAFTYCSKPDPLVEAAQKVLKSAISIVKPGVTIGEIGEKIEETAKSLGFGIIVNLTGHYLGRYDFHASPFIPNIKNDSKHTLKKGDVIALEPFVCKTNGYIKDSSIIEIYRYIQDRPVRLMEARKILELAKNQFHGLPFAKRWLYRYFSPLKVSLALNQLQAAGALETYPVLREVENKKTAQAEHTMIVDDPPIGTTL